jgi:hypothetical protein
MLDADTAAALVIIPDCNVLIHGKGMRVLPWQDLNADEIEVLIIGPVLREVDALKTRSGRPGRLARDISSDLR